MMMVKPKKAHLIKQVKNATRRVIAFVVAFSMVVFPFPTFSFAEQPIAMSPTGDPVPTVPFNPDAPPVEPDQTIQNASEETDLAWVSEDNQTLSEAETTMQGSATINDGAEYTSRATIDLRIDATDENSEVSEYQFSTDGGVSWSNWKTFASSDEREDEKRMKAEASLLLEGTPYATEGLTEIITNQMKDSESRITYEIKNYSDAEGKVLIETSLNKSYNSAGVNTYETQGSTLYDSSGKAVQSISKTVMQNSHGTVWLESVSLSDINPTTSRGTRSFSYNHVYDSISIYEAFYDEKGNIEQSTQVQLFPDGSVKSKSKSVYTYNESGTMKTQITKQFDGTGQLVSSSEQTNAYHETTSKIKTEEILNKDVQGRIRSTVTKFYDENGRQTNQENVSFDSYGIISSRTLATTEYNEKGRTSRTTSRQMNAGGLITSEQTIEYEYNDTGRMITQKQTQVDDAGRRTEYLTTYDGSDASTKTTERKTTYFDAAGLLTQTRVERYRYDDRGQQIAYEDETKDANENLASKNEMRTEFYPGTSIKKSEMELKYGQGNVLLSSSIREWDERSHATKDVRTSWDADGNEIGTGTYTYTYDANGSVSYTYANVERFPKTEEVQTSTETTRYPSGARQTETIRSRDERSFETVTVNEFDETGRTIKQTTTRTNPLGELYYRSTYTYEYQDGRIVGRKSVEESLKRGTSSESETLTEYSALGVVKSTATTQRSNTGERSVTLQHYDESGRRIRMESSSYNGLGQLTSKSVDTTVYDDRGRTEMNESRVENGQGRLLTLNRVEYTYFEDGIQKTLKTTNTSTSGSTTIYESQYKQDHVTEQTVQTYLDASGSVTSKSTTTYVYDGTRMLKSTTESENANGESISTQETTYEYHPNGSRALQISASQNIDGSSSKSIYRTDTLGRMLENVSIYSNATGSVASIYYNAPSYDENGRQVRNEITYLDGKGNVSWYQMHESTYDASSGKLVKQMFTYFSSSGSGSKSTTQYNEQGQTQTTSSESFELDDAQLKRLDLVERYGNSTVPVNPAEKTIHTTLSLSGSDGEKNVLVQVKNAADQVSTFSDRIVLDTTPPTASFKINGGAEQTTDNEVVIDLNQVGDATSGLTSIRISTNDGVSWMELDLSQLGADKTVHIQLEGASGMKNVLLEVKDRAGLKSLERQTILLEDRVAPKIQIPDGLDGSTTNRLSIQVAYTVDGAARTRIFELIEDNNRLALTETDASGNETILEFTVVRDTAAPVVEISPELQEAILENEPLTVSEETYSVTYTMGGVEKTKVFELNEGDNVLEIRETDEVGNETLLTFHVHRDSIPPEIVIPETIAGAVTNQRRFEIQYMVDGVEKTKLFQLEEGDNELAIEERDEAGNITHKTIIVTLDTTPPEITLPEGTDGSQTSESSVTIVYLVDGVEKTKTFELAEGENNFNITEADRSGNHATLSFKIMRVSAADLAAKDAFERAKPAVEEITVGEDGKIKVPFTPIKDAKVYQVQVARDKDFKDIIHEGFPSGNFEPFVLSDDVDNYFIRVRGSKSDKVEDGHLSEWSDTIVYQKNKNIGASISKVVLTMNRDEGEAADQGKKPGDKGKHLKKPKAIIDDQNYLTPEALMRRVKPTTRTYDPIEFWWKDRMQAKEEIREQKNTRFFGLRPSALLEAILLNEALEKSNLKEGFANAGMMATGLVPLKMMTLRDKHYPQMSAMPRRPMLTNVKPLKKQKPKKQAKDSERQIPRKLPQKESEK